MPSLVKRYADYLGLSASTLCLLHCLAVPVLFAVFSVSLTAASGWIEYIFVGLTLLAVVLAFTRKPSLRVRGLLLVGAVLFVVSMFLPEPVSGFNVAHIPACVLIGTGHWVNLRQEKRCATPYAAKPMAMRSASADRLPASQAA
jgi:hypothetical protein